jgi:hypothetical protein
VGGVEQIFLEFRALGVYIEGQRLWEIWKNKIKKFAQGYVVGLARASLVHQADFHITYFPAPSHVPHPAGPENFDPFFRIVKQIHDHCSSTYIRWMEE